MLIDTEIFDVSYEQLKKVWKTVEKFNCVLVGGWAAHMLTEENFDSKLFKELYEKFKFDKTPAKKEVKNAGAYFKTLGFSEAEIANLEVSFTSLLI